MNTEKRDKIILITGMAVFIAFWTVVAVFKYRNGGYGGLDLAIYNNTFWNTVHGHFFASSIHAPSYLGDHAEWFIAPLALIYYFFPSPLTLIVLQILALTACAVPIYLIAKFVLAEQKRAFVFPLIWLLNFTVCYNAIWEFHLLVFALPFIFFAAYYFLRKKFWRFLLFLGLALLCREDVALVALGFSLCYLHDPAAWQKGERIKIVKWTLLPLSLAFFVFFTDLQIITAFNPQGIYKYAYYFHATGSSIGEIFSAVTTRLLPLILKIFSLTSLKILFILLLSFLFIPLRRPRFLLLSLPSFLLLAATNNNDWFLPLQTHYALLLFPGLIIAAIYGLKSLLADKRQLLPKRLLPLLLIITAVFFLFALGPGLAVPNVFSAAPDVVAEQHAAALIPPNASVVTSFAPATALSGREKLYDLDYVWFGKNEFASANYLLPALPDYILLNERFFLPYAFSQNKSDPSDAQAQSGDVRLRQLLDASDYKIIFDENNVVLMKNSGGASARPFINLLAIPPKGAVSDDKTLTPNLKLIGYQQSIKGWLLYFKTSGPLDMNTVIKINNDLLPFGQGLLPPDQISAPAVIEYSYSTPADKLSIGLYAAAGSLDLLRDEQTSFEFSKLTPLGPTVNLP